MQFKSLIFPSLLAAVFLTGCSKDASLSDAERLTVEEASQDYLLTEKICEDVFKTIDVEGKQQGKLLHRTELQG